MRSTWNSTTYTLRLSCNQHLQVSLGSTFWHLMVSVCQLKGHIVACGTKGSTFPIPVLHGARLNVCQGSRQWTSAASSTVPGLRPQQCIQCHVHITSKLSELLQDAFVCVMFAHGGKHYALMQKQQTRG